MCRSIKTLFNFEPPATDDEVRAEGPRDGGGEGAGTGREAETRVALNRRSGVQSREE